MNYKKLVFAFAIATVSLPALYNVAQAETPEPAPVSAQAEALPPEITGQQKELDLFRSSLRMEKWNFVKQAMALNGEEEKKFLSQYNKYEADLKKLNDKRVAIIKDYVANFEKMNDKEAGELVKRSFKFRKQRIALLEKYYGKIAKATSKVIGARFLQVESVLQGAGDVAIGSEIPLMSK
ncbi:MAG: hypothetical protein ACU88J_08405 [Gammaproteobacteria bacterium]